MANYVLSAFVNSSQLDKIILAMWGVEQGKIVLLTTQPMDAGTILYLIEEHWFKPTLNGRMCYNILWCNFKIQNLILPNLKVLKIFNSH